MNYYIGQRVDSFNVELEIGVKHVDHQSLVDAGRVHLVLQLFDELVARRGKVPLEHFEFDLVVHSLRLQVVQRHQRRSVNVFVLLAATLGRRRRRRRRRTSSRSIGRGRSSSRRSGSSNLRRYKKKATFSLNIKPVR